MKPFLLLASRAQDAPADAEYEAFRRFGGLEVDQLIRHRMEQQPIGDLDLDAYAGIVLGGSPFTISDPPHAKSATQVRVEAELADLIAEVIRRDTPFLGACYGIGVIGRHLGAVIDGTYSEPVGPCMLRLTDAGREDPLLGILPDSFEAFLGHKEAITSLPDGIAPLVSSAACPVQAFRVGTNVYATQFHPELDIPGMITRIDAYKHAGYFPPEEAEEVKATARASDVHQPGRLMARFVELYADGPAAADPAASLASAPTSPR